MGGHGILSRKRNKKWQMALHVRNFGKQKGKWGIPGGSGPKSVKTAKREIVEEALDGDRKKIKALRNDTYTKLEDNFILVKLDAEESQWFTPRAGKPWRKEIQEAHPNTKHGYVWVDIDQVLAAAEANAPPVPWVNAAHLVPWTAHSLCKHKNAILSLCRDDEPTTSSSSSHAFTPDEPVCAECKKEPCWPGYRYCGISCGRAAKRRRMHR